MDKKRLLSLFLCLIIIAGIAPFALAASENSSTVAASASEKVSSKNVNFPIYQEGKKVTFKWTSLKNAHNYNYYVKDLGSGKYISKRLTSNASGSMSASLAKEGSYKVIVNALNSKKKVISVFTGYFHIGKISVKPTGTYTPKGFKTSGTKLAVATASPKPTPKPSATAKPTAVAASATPKATKDQSIYSTPGMSPPPTFTPPALPHDAPEYMYDNAYFKSDNSNDVEHWMNSTLNDTFWNDVYKMEKNDDLGLIDIDYIMERDVFKQLNQYRKSRGLNELIWNDNLARMARARSMAHILQSASLSKRYSHTMSEIGGHIEGSYTRWGVMSRENASARENIAWFAHETNPRPDFYANQVIQEWIDSEDHMQNMRRTANYGAIGVVWSNNMYMGGYTGMDVVMLTNE